jgi:leader peptidase (prepilin peptidase)/N-methyltransferase
LSVDTNIPVPTPWLPVLRNHRYLAISVAMGALGGAGVYFAHWKLDAVGPLTVAGMAFSLYAALVSMIDLRTHRLPNAFTYPAAAVALLFAAGLGWANSDWSLFLGGLYGGLAAYGMWWVAAFVTRQIGYGDVKFMAAAGFLLGTVSWQAWLAGALVFPGMCILLLGPLAAINFKRGPKIPAGPILGLGMVLALALAPSLATFTY